jgi:hypothetical protein
VNEINFGYPDPIQAIFSALTGGGNGMRLSVRILIAGAGLYLTLLMGQTGMILLGWTAGGL